MAGSTITGGSVEDAGCNCFDIVNNNIRYSLYRMRTIVLSQSLEVSRPSHCISLYTRGDPPSTPWSCLVVLVWHHSWQKREIDRERERKRDAALEGENLTGLSRDCHGRNYVVRSGRLPAENIGPVICS